ncbi:hypothetical protein QBC44DRAFT_366734 [Cladorrhinum sp. PSN332]|nr:hypothetical protein QBC44DRAFT_366734 [Cladorrhinum sp. PSN332]
MNLILQEFLTPSQFRALLPPGVDLQPIFLGLIFQFIDSPEHRLLDIAGIGVFITFAAALFGSILVAFVVHCFFEAPDIFSKKEDNDAGNYGDNSTGGKTWNRIHHALDKILVAWSDQQIVLGLATSIAAIVIHRSPDSEPFSMYHLNILKQWLVFASVTHTNALLIHCDYFNGEATLRHRLAHNFDPRPPMLPSSCFWKNATLTRPAGLTTVEGWGNDGATSFVLFGFSVAFLAVGILSIFFNRPTSRKPSDLTREQKKWSWVTRFVLWVANSVLGIAVFVYTLKLRDYMNSKSGCETKPTFKFLEDGSENEWSSYGQFVPILLSVGVLISAAESILDDAEEDKTTNKGPPSNSGDDIPLSPYPN